MDFRERVIWTLERESDMDSRERERESDMDSRETNEL